MATPDRPTTAVPPRPMAQGADSRTIIGKGIVITGEISGTGDVEVRGIVNGSITLKNNVATVAKSGVAQASVTAKNVEVSGRVEGDVVAEELVIIRKDSTVAGNVTSPRVSLEDGAHFKGSIDMQPAAEAQRRQPAQGATGMSSAARPGSPPKPVRDAQSKPSAQN